MVINIVKKNCKCCPLPKCRIAGNLIAMFFCDNLMGNTADATLRVNVVVREQMPYLTLFFSFVVKLCSNPLLFAVLMLYQTQ